MDPAPTEPAPAPDERSTTTNDLSRIWTIPNVFTFVRFLLIPLLCWMILTGTAQGTWTPVILLAVWASTDWIDGVLARALNQVSRLGQVFDPLADRVGITAILISFAVIEVVQWWMLALIVAVDAMVVALTHRSMRDGSLKVSWIGKIRTACLLVAIVLMVLGVSVWEPAIRIADGLMILGVVLHVVAGVGYINIARAHPIARAS